MHAELVRDALRARGIDAEMVLGETPSDERIVSSKISVPGA